MKGLLVALLGSLLVVDAQNAQAVPTVTRAAAPVVRIGNRTAIKKKKVKKDWRYIWKPSTFRTYHFRIDPQDLATLDANPAAEEYVPCSVEIDYGTDYSKSFEECGCRYKGSVGSLRICLDPLTGRFDPNECRKLSWKINADKYMEEGKQDIYGQDRLVFNGLAVDYSLMSERLAYTLIQDANMKGPLAHHAKVYLNDKFDGVYSMVESPENEFTRRLWSRDINGGEGALYKDAMLGAHEDEDYYQEFHQSGKDENAFMVEVSKAMKEAELEGPDELNKVFYKYFVVESVVNVTAINSLLGMNDDWRMKHNFFWYVWEFPDRRKGAGENATVKKLHMIPWDYDRTNDEASKDRLPPGAPPHWYDPFNKKDLTCIADPIPPDVKAKSMGPDPRVQNYWLQVFSFLPYDVDTPINCLTFTSMLKTEKAKVDERQRWLAENVMSDAQVAAHLDYFTRQIRSAVKVDPDPPTEFEWDRNIEKLKTWIRDTRQEVLYPTPYVEGTAGLGQVDPEFLQITGTTEKEVANLMTSGDMNRIMIWNQQLMQNPVIAAAMQRYSATGKTGFLTGPMAPQTAQRPPQSLPQQPQSQPRPQTIPSQQPRPQSQFQQPGRPTFQQQPRGTFRG